MLGAGVSALRGIPQWDKLAKLVWHRVFRSRSSPWTGASREQSTKTVPEFLPIVFELAYRELGRAHRERGEAKFFEVLKECLYKNARYPDQVRGFAKSKESLAVLARVIVNEYNRGQSRRIDAIITFNADDLIERAVDYLDIRDLMAKHESPAVLSIARSTHSWSTQSMRWIPVYHIHGFLPSPDFNRGQPGHSLRVWRAKEMYKIYEHMLVFTNVQYWSTSAGAMSFANRIMASALSEGRCIFIGLSMTDINLLRWLALRTLERDQDETEGRRRAAWAGHGFEKALPRHFARHFWIRPDSDDPSGFLSSFLRLRGVEVIQIPDWSGDSFCRLMMRCFP